MTVLKQENPEIQGTDGASINKDKTQQLLLSKLEITADEVIKPPQNAWTLDGQILGTLGNFSMLTGKAKAKKTFALTIGIAGATQKNPIFGRFSNTLPEDKLNVLHFDTEQSKYHVQLTLKRICKLSGLAEPENLKVYGLRSLNPKERLDIIEYAIYNTPNLGLVVIDGIKDLINSINNEEEATMLTSKFLKWTEEKEIHIITVLHQNKTSEHARGHIGTEMLNKCETVLSVNVDEKDKEISVITPEQTRNKEPQPFAFRVNEEGLPEEVLNYQFAKEMPIGQRNFLMELSEDKKYEIIESVFVREAERKSLKRKDRFDIGITYSQLIGDIKYLTENFHNEKVGDNKIKTFITHCKMKVYLSQEKERKPYQLLKFKVEDLESTHKDQIIF